MGWKHTEVKATVSEAVSTAFGAMEELRDEVQEIVDNASGTNLENTSRIQTFSETASTLDSYCDEPDVPEWVEELDANYTETTPASKRRGPSRATRRDNAVAAVDAAISACEDYIGALDEMDPWGDEHPLYAEHVLACGGADKATPFEKWAQDHPKPDDALTQDEIDTRKSDVEEFVSELEDAKSEWEGVEFPGMFG